VTGDGDALAIAALNYTPGVEVVWVRPGAAKKDKKGARVGFAVDVKEFCEAISPPEATSADEPEKKLSEDERVARVQQGVAALLLAGGCDFWEKSWAFSQVGDTAAFGLVRSIDPAVFPVLPTSLESLQRLAGEDSDEPAPEADQPEDAHGRLINIVRRGMAAAKRKPEKATIGAWRVPVRFRRLCQIFCYWRGGTSQVLALRKRDARRKRRAEEPAEDPRPATRLAAPPRPDLLADISALEAETRVAEESSATSGDAASSPEIASLVEELVSCSGAAV
jgi:hypothetical protein